MTDNNATPTMERVIQDAIRAALLNINTAMPGVVRSYNAATNQATIQPSFKRKYTDNSTVDLPLIYNVPVAFPRANKAALTFPLKAGDTVLLIFSQRSIDNWKNVGGTISPNDPRLHDLSDAIAIPGVYASSDPIVVDPVNLVLRNDKSKVTLKPLGDILIEGGIGKIEVKKDGKITVGNGSIDLLDLVDKLLDAIMVLTVPTAVGPSGVPINTATFTQIKAQLALIKG